MAREQVALRSGAARRCFAPIALVLSLRAGGVVAQTDHSPPAAELQPQPSAPSTAQADASRDSAIFGPEPDANSSTPAAAPARKDAGSGPKVPERPGSDGFTKPPEDPLKVGGMLYLRAASSLLSGQPLSDASFSTPSLLDVYLDARPNDRVRGFVLGRVSYDAAREGTSSADRAALSSGDNSGTSSLSSVLTPAGAAPHAILDQAWLRFDVAHTLFVTAGKQHVRWGTGRFWAPTDYLHTQRRNPLAVFDARAGTSMLKLHLPIESKNWNLYGYAITENASATTTLSRIAFATRAEFVFSTLELGLGVFARKETKPKFAADVSFGLGDFDFYGEAAVLDESDFDRVRWSPDAPLPPAPVPPSWQTPADAARARVEQVVDARYPTYRIDGYRAQVVGGFSYSARYGANDTLTLGAEYFYNSLGYSDPKDYLGLILPHSTDLSNPATFFYLGRHYAALYLTLPSPFSLDLHSFALSTLSNLSDGSIVSRLDYTLTLLTHLRFEAFVALRYGKKDGEFRLGIGPVTLGELTIQSPPAVLDLGVALRLSL